MFYSWLKFAWYNTNCYLIQLKNEFLLLFPSAKPLFVLKRMKYCSQLKNTEQIQLQKKKLKNMQIVGEAQNFNSY